jgi:hypothetical protein
MPPGLPQAWSSEAVALMTKVRELLDRQA